jgi:hypothetical protein
MEMTPAGVGGVFDGVGKAVDNLVNAANTGGGFTVSHEGGQALINAIDTYQAKLRQHLNSAHLLSQRLPLGTSPAANTFTPFLSTVASDQTQGAIPAMRKLKQRLDEARSAIQRSMAGYHTTEQDNVASLNSGTAK